MSFYKLFLSWIKRPLAKELDGLVDAIPDAALPEFKVRLKAEIARWLKI